MLTLPGAHVDTGWSTVDNSKFLNYKRFFFLTNRTRYWLVEYRKEVHVREFVPDASCKLSNI